MQDGRKEPNGAGLMVYISLASESSLDSSRVIRVLSARDPFGGLAQGEFTIQPTPA